MIPNPQQHPQEPLTSLTKLYLAEVEAEMMHVLNPENPAAQSLLGMLHYHMGWVNERFESVTVNSGKRIRPLLCLLACAAAGGDWRQAIPAASSIELLHNFTLIHDDIQDNSLIRRGRPTVWQIWGVNLAINAGDTLFALSHLAMTRLALFGTAADHVVEEIRRLDQACVALTLGQHADMTFESSADITVADYLAMIEGKTATLLALAAGLGALVAGQPDEALEHYYEFGRNLGLAFQVRDDILGIWGEEEVIGKSAATDIANKKKSLPVLYGLAQSDELRRLYVLPITDQPFIDKAVQLLNEVNAKEYAENNEKKYSRLALDHLAAASPQGDDAVALNQLVNNLLGRYS